MNNLSIVQNNIPPMSEVAIDNVYQLESFALSLPQINIETSHIIHGGMYARTIMIPAGVMITGALIKIATILIVQGDVIVYIGDNEIALSGYNVLAASANRKQAFIAKTNVFLTMIFPSDAMSIVDAEKQFTDESDMLISRKCTDNHIVITGE